MSAQTTNEHLLLLRSDEWYNHLSAEELQQVINQCKTWLDRLTEQGKIKAGQGLGPRGTIVSNKTARVTADGPFAEAKEVVGGYLLLRAQSFEEAIAIAKTNPTLAYGTSIEVRPIAEECPLDALARQIREEERLITA